MHTMRARVAAVATVTLALGFVATASGALAPSTFESTDGNTVVNTTQDWDGLGPGTTLEADQADTLTGPTDESFTQGTKSDTAVPTVEFGSIPPNKSDLTRMRIASETVDGDVFLYVAWNRSNTLGSANMNFEFDQSATVSANGYTPIRTTGDVLITFDFASGGAVVDLGLARWGMADCEANGGKPPDCWSALVDLDASGIADGSVSADQRFGEAAINLSAAGVFSGDLCTTFGAAYLTSRSSSAFTAALKDFVPPASISITNCGSLNIVKTDDAGAALAGAGFTLYDDLAPVGGTRGVEDTVTDPVLTCTTAADGTCTILNIPFGPYWLVETTVPAGHDAAPDTAVVIQDTTQVTVNLVDPRQRGAIQVVKTAKHFGPGTADLVATFSIRQAGVEVASVVTDATGVGCADGLLLGAYTVQEVSGPAGYLLDDDVEAVTLDTAGTCASGYETVSFENQPLSDVTVQFAPQVTGGTAASIVCVDSSATVLEAQTPDATPGATVFDDTSETYADLVEGTYVCTIVIDP